ncbi:MAG: PP2C family protein-serine/threonine phosphatase [Rhodothermales bacterium]
MIEPKDSDRKMDALLARIGKGSENKHYLPSIMKALEATFGADLHIGNGRIYMEDGSTFVLVDRSGSVRLGRRIPTDLEAVQQVLTHGSYIYDDPDVTAFKGAGDAHAVPAAFAVVPGLNRRWIFAYDLQNGWIHEEVQLCMNAVRAALNYRLSLENIKSGLEQAAEIQRSLLPTRAPQVEGFEIAERSQPAEIVGGDLFDYLHFGEEILGVSIGDASGHGLPAALLVRDVVTGLRMGMEEEMKMVYTFRKLNRVIHRSMLSSRFVSLFYSEVERNGNLLYVNAGHPPPLLVRGTDVQELTRTGMILGALSELPLRRAYAYMDPGAVLVLYTDGIFERRNGKKEQFEIDRLKALVVQHQEKPPCALVDLIFDEVFAFGEEKAWEDDATVVVIKRAPSP